VRLELLNNIAEQRRVQEEQRRQDRLDQEEQRRQDRELFVQLQKDSAERFRQQQKDSEERFIQLFQRLPVFQPTQSAALEIDHSVADSSSPSRADENPFETQARLSELSATIKHLSQQIGDLQKQLSAKDTIIDRLSKQISSLLQNQQFRSPSHAAPSRLESDATAPASLTAPRSAAEPPVSSHPGQAAESSFNSFVRNFPLTQRTQHTPSSSTVRSTVTSGASVQRTLSFPRVQRNQLPTLSSASSAPHSNTSSDDMEEEVNAMRQAASLTLTPSNDD
jgi:uncharacterized coiled-coil protein SlyX